jgi:beta-carotene 3-hydroxylase
MLQFMGWVAFGFVGLEVLSYALHRWVFHGVLWRIHRTHHGVRHGSFELNDLFAIGFAAASIALIVVGLADPLRSPAFGVGVGFTLYGAVYFVVHDLFTHRRYLKFRSDNRLLRLLKRAHLKHHRSTSQDGSEPFGLFLVRRGDFKDSKVLRER